MLCSSESKAFVHFAKRGTPCVRGLLVSGDSLCQRTPYIRGPLVSGDSLCQGTPCVRGLRVHVHNMNIYFGFFRSANVHVSLCSSQELE